MATNNHSSVNPFKVKGAGADPVTSPVTSPVKSLFISAPKYSEEWYLHEMGRLHNFVSAKLAYQMGSIGIQSHPNSLPIRMAISYSAIHTGRCHWALHHLRIVMAQATKEIHRTMARKAITLCLGGWRNRALIMGQSVRIKSLSGYSAVNQLDIAPGSQLSHICQAIVGSCEQIIFNHSNYHPTSGTEILHGIATINELRDLNGSSYIGTKLMRRITTKPNFGGDSVALGYGHYWQKYANRKIGLHIKATHSNFERGPSYPDFSSNEINVATTYQHSPGPNRNRFSAVHLTDPWWWQVKSKWHLSHLTMMEKNTSYRLLMAGYHITMPLLTGYKFEIGTHFGRLVPEAKFHRALASTITGSHINLYAPPDWPVTIRLGLALTNKQYHETLMHLVRPHRDEQREWTIAIGRSFGSKKQFNIRILGNINKISSENSLARKSNNSLTIYFNYEIMN